MKKILFLIFIVAIGCFLYNHFNDTKKEEEKEKFIYEDLFQEIGDKTVDITSYTIYGKHLNLKGDLPNTTDTFTIVLKNDKQDIQVPIESDETSFSTSKYINDGINLDKLEVGKYLLLLCDNKEQPVCYRLINNTTYHNNEYYTMTNKNKSNHLITFDEKKYNEINYWEINVQETTLPDDIYDIVIDPGHGGIDTGASNGKYHESKFNLEHALKLKEALEEEGLKVKLTREKDEQLDFYGANTRTGIPYEVKAKLMLSLHLNSSNYKNQYGVEIYRAYQDNNDFAKILADNIVNYANTAYSINPMNKVFNGVYMRVYSKADKNSIKVEAKKYGYEPYTIGDDVTYYYFIRETGGIMTKAFSDGRNPKYKENIYRNNNQAVEAYLCELGYISNNNDLKNIINNQDGYIKALKESVITYVNS